MTKFPLTSLAFFAPADNGSGATAQAGVSPAPATETAPTAPAAKSLTTLETAALFAQQRRDAAKAEAKPTPTDTTPAATTTPATGSDAGGKDGEDGAATQTTPEDTPAEGDLGEEEEVKPLEGLTPERQQQQQAGIDKLKERAATAKAEAAALKAELDALKASAATPKDPAPATPAALPPDGNPLFAAQSREEVVELVEQAQYSIMHGKDLLARMDADGLTDAADVLELPSRDGSTVNLKRSDILKDIKTLERRVITKDRALLHLDQRQQGLAQAAKLHPEYFAHGKPKPAVQAVLAQIPELALRPDGIGIAAELAAARAAKAKAAPVVKPAAPAASPTPAKPAAAPVPAVAANPAVLASRPHPLGSDSAPRSLSVMDMARRHSVARQAS